MAVESDTDRRGFLSDFGETFTLADSTEVTGLFEEPFSDDLDFASKRLSALFVSADVAGVGYGDRITRAADGIAYYARRRQPDGTGFTVIFFEKPDGSGFDAGFSPGFGSA